MHLKKNNCESFVGTIMNMKGKGKDQKNARADLEEMGIRLQIYVQEVKNEKDLLVAAATMSRKTFWERSLWIRNEKCTIKSIFLF